MRIRHARFFVGVLCLTILAFASVWADDLRIVRGQMLDMLNVVSKDVEKNYYDPKLKGLDWKALTGQARQQIEKANNMDDMMNAIFTLVYRLKDSHTTFLPPGRVRKLHFGFEAKPFGNEIRVYEVKKDGPAVAAGISIGDRILQVNNFTAERNTFDTMMMFFRIIKPTEQLNIAFQHAEAAPKTATLKAKVKQGQAIQDLTNGFGLEELLREQEQSEWHFKVVFDEGIGYMNVPSFAHSSRPDKFDNERALIVDLRGNFGGQLDLLQELAEHFVDKPSKLADKVERNKTEEIKLAPRSPNFAGMPIIVMVDSESSSAAELFARFLQLRGNSVIIGDRSSGRVMAARVFYNQLGYGTIVPFATYIAVAKIVFSDGSDLEHQGVTPDVPCVSTPSDLTSHSDHCLMEAVSVAREKLGLEKQVPDKTGSQITALAAEMSERSDHEYQKQ